MKPAKSNLRKPFPRGFALVVSLSMMILMTIIAIGMLSLSALSLKTSAQSEAMSEARANARLALMMAIGELQTELGPDSRISAPFDAGSTATGGRRHWTAVYDAWRQPDDPATPESPATRNPVFRRWLVSGANAANGGPPGTGEQALLAGPKSLGANAAPEDEIRAPMLPVTSGKLPGRIAWWTSDESMKAKINAGPDPGSSTSPLVDTQSPPNVGHRAIPDLANFVWKPGQRASAVTNRVVNLAANLGNNGLGGVNHDITVHSAGVLSDVRAGRLRRDLSQLLTRPVEQLEDMPLYLSDGRINRFEVNAAGEVSNRGFIPPWNSSINTPNEWGINLEELHLFHNVHRELTWNSGGPALTMKSTREQVVRDRYYLYKRPVIDAVQFILSLKAESFQGSYRMVMMLDGMVALSNPHDVPIIWPAGLLLPVQLQNIPYTLKWNIEKANGTTNTNQATSADFGLFVGRVSGGTTGQSQGFRLEPGESAVFGSTTGNGPQLDLMRGFQPSGGVRINPNAANGWDLRATGLAANDMLDFTLTKGDTGYAGTHSYYNIWIGDRRTGANAKGWQTDSCTLSGSGSLTSPRMDQLLISPIRPTQKRPVRDFTSPQPIMMISFLRNVERPSGALPLDAFASRPFLLGEPVAAGRSLVPSSIDNSLHTSQYLITAEPLNYQFRTLAAGQGGRNAYHGGGRQPNLGGSFNAIKRRIPLAPPLSLGAFEHAVASGFNSRFHDAPAIGPDPIPSDAMALSGHKPASPCVSKAIGNSWASPYLPSGVVHTPPAAGRRTAADHSWMANTALWDSWFLSGVVDGTGINSASWFNDPRNPRAQFSDFVQGKDSLRNKRFLFHPGKPANAVLEELFESSGKFKPSALNKLPAYLLVDGAFNVNSTSVNAWAAFLSSVRDQEILIAGGARQAFEHPFGTLGYAVNASLTGAQGDWMGLRSLNSEEIKTLAEAIVTQVKARGPFLSMADFVNRRPNSSESGHQVLGALQAAIEASGLNSRYSAAGRTVAAADFNPLAGAAIVDSEPTPSRTMGAAGFLSQGALLASIGSQIAVRGDTFVIRTYGDARDAKGKILAKAWCEAVVQRTPEYVDPSDAPDAQQGWPRAADTLSDANTRFGRRLQIVSFRWLHRDEV